jgi:hypothetical protein
MQEDLLDWRDWSFTSTSCMAMDKAQVIMVAPSESICMSLLSNHRSVPDNNRLLFLSQPLLFAMTINETGPSTIPGPALVTAWLAHHPGISSISKIENFHSCSDQLPTRAASLDTKSSTTNGCDTFPT